MSLILYPSYALSYLRSKWLYHLITRNKGLEIKGRLILDGRPMISITEGASIIIKNNVTLNSINKKEYHVNMYAPVKLLADRPEAKITIGENTRIHGTCIHAYKEINIGSNCLIAANAQIFDGSGHALAFPDVENRINTRGDAKPITIADNVWVGANCIILPGTRIGNGSIIAAGSVVVGDIPSFVVAGGNPAKVIKDYSNERF